MRKPVLAFCLLVLVVGLVAGIWLFLPPDTPQVQSRTTGTADVDDVVPKPRDPLPREKQDAIDERAAPAEKHPEDSPAPSPGQTQENPAPASVSGRVIDASTNEPIAGATASVLYKEDGDTKRLSADTDAEGRFRIELPEIPPDATVTARSAEHDTPEALPVTAGENLIKLLPTTCVIVFMDDVVGIPDAAWIRWEDGEQSEHHGESFDESTGSARIVLRDFTQARDARVCVNWLGSVLEGDVLRIEPNRRHEVRLSPPDGAVVTVRVIGPDGRAMRDVLVKVHDRRLHEATARTGVDGEIVMRKVPAPARLEVRLIEVGRAPFCVEGRAVTVSNVGDRIDVLFDLTDTGIVECNLTFNGERLPRLRISGLDEESDVSGKYVYLPADENVDGANRIYGLKPGRYSVELDDRDYTRKFKAEFEVQPAPAISNWNKDFRSYTLTVRVVGAPSTEGVVVRYFNAYSRPLGEARRNEDGNYVIENLSAGEIRLRASGAGCASRVVIVDPSLVSEIDVSVERSGRLKLTPRGDEGGELTIKRSGDDADVFRLALQGEEKETVIELAPGVYNVSFLRMNAAPWKSVDVTVTAGEETVCEYGPAYTSLLKVLVRDRTSLWPLDVKLRQDGRDVPYWTFSLAGQDGEEYHQFMFEAEGKLTLVVTGSTIEDFQREFEVSRGGSAELEIELKRKK